MSRTAEKRCRGTMPTATRCNWRLDRDNNLIFFWCVSLTVAIKSYRLGTSKQLHQNALINRTALNSKASIPHLLQYEFIIHYNQPKEVKSSNISNSITSIKNNLE